MNISHIVQLAKEYDALLTRYACCLVKDQSVAERIVIKVFEQYYDGNTVLNGIALRRYLQSRTTRECKDWLRKNHGSFHNFHKTSMN